MFLLLCLRKHWRKEECSTRRKSLSLSIQKVTYVSFFIFLQPFVSSAFLIFSFMFTAQWISYKGGASKVVWLPTVFVVSHRLILYEQLSCYHCSFIHISYLIISLSNILYMQIESPFPPSDKLAVTSVQSATESIIPMKQMKMEWVPYIPFEKRYLLGWPKAH